MRRLVAIFALVLLSVEARANDSECGRDAPVGFCGVGRGTRLTTHVAHIGGSRASTHTTFTVGRGMPRARPPFMASVSRIGRHSPHYDTQAINPARI